MDKITSLGFWVRASEFQAAADVLYKKKGEGFRPTYFLLCLAIELCLKGYLRGSGASIQSLKNNFRHNLVSTLGACEKQGLQGLIAISGQDRAMLARINYFYRSSDLRYSVTARETKNLPRQERLSAFSNQLLQATKEFC